MKRLICLLLMLCCGSAIAADIHTTIPKNAPALLPEVRRVQVESWPDAPIPSFLAAQIEQESCISLTHSKCWNPYSQLKTSREWGFGLGQTTIAYNPDGSVRFNVQADLRRQYASLRGWSDDKKFDAHYQILALVEMDHGIYRRVTWASDDRERLAFTVSAYNGGESGIRQDRLLCKNTPGCDNSRWFGNVELYSTKAKKPFHGYGQSPFDINRGYVRYVIDIRRPKYDRYFDVVIAK